jgi:glutamate/tyrosine decarboxylase-like PLP-dependent enzyme
MPSLRTSSVRIYQSTQGKEHTDDGTDYEEYPVSADIQNRCVSMIARLFNVPTQDEEKAAVGTSTIGSSEVTLLANGS